MKTFKENSVSSELVGCEVDLLDEVPKWGKVNVGLQWIGPTCVAKEYPDEGRSGL